MIHWGVDTDMFHPSVTPKDTETNRILAVGRLAARKGYGSLLRAFAEVKQRNPKTELLIVGRGNLKNRLIKTLVSNGYKGKFIVPLPNLKIS